MRCRGDEKKFTGVVWLEDLVSGRRPASASVHRVLFEPGARTHWHSHPRGQVLCIATGKGRVGIAERVMQVAAGDIVYAAPQERHWHGAAPDRSLVHLAINPSITGQPDENTIWAEEVTEREYQR